MSNKQAEIYIKFDGLERKGKVKRRKKERKGEVTWRTAENSGGSWERVN